MAASRVCSFLPLGAKHVAPASGFCTRLWRLSDSPPYFCCWCFLSTPLVYLIRRGVCLRRGRQPQGRECGRGRREAERLRPAPVLSVGLHVGVSYGGWWLFGCRRRESVLSCRRASAAPPCFFFSLWLTCPPMAWRHLWMRDTKLHSPAAGRRGTTREQSMGFTRGQRRGILIIYACGTRVPFFLLLF